MLSVFSITMKRNLTTSCLQRNKRMSPFGCIKEWLCKSFACYSLLPEALLKSVFQITVSESRLASSEGNSKRQLRKKWGIYTSRAVPLRQFHGMRRGVDLMLTKMPSDFKNLISPAELYARVTMPNSVPGIFHAMSMYMWITWSKENIWQQQTRKTKVLIKYASRGYLTCMKLSE